MLTYCNGPKVGIQLLKRVDVFHYLKTWRLCVCYYNTSTLLLSKTTTGLKINHLISNYDITILSHVYSSRTHSNVCNTAFILE